MKLKQIRLCNGPVLGKLLLFLMCLLGAGVISVYLGQDGNYDLKNYHFYNPWAFLNGRFHTDLSAAGIQTYTSPLMDVPYYLLVKYLGASPRLVAFIMGFPYGILVYLSFLITWHMTHIYNFTKLFRILATATLVIFSATAAGTFCEIGTTFNDIPTACFILAAIYLLIKNENDSTWKVVVAGALAGLGAALKLTCCIFAPAIMIALFSLYPRWKTCLKQAVYFAGSWWMAFLIGYGWFGYQYYKLTGSPVFPMFENIFPSKWLLGNDVNPNPWLPQSLARAVFHPFYWAKMNVNLVAEPPFADPRFAIVFCLIGIGVILLCYRMLYVIILKMIRQCPSSNGYSKNHNIFPGRFLLVFFLLGYSLWEYMFSNLRYAISLEALLGAICLILLYSMLENLYKMLIVQVSKKQIPDLTESLNDTHDRMLAHRPLIFHTTVLSLFILIGTLATTHQIDSFGRVPYGKKVFEIIAPKLPDNTQVIILGNQGAYLAPELAKGVKGVRFIGLTNILMDPKSRNYPYWEALKTKIYQHSGPTAVLIFPQFSYFGSILSDLGVQIQSDTYASIISNLDPGLKIRIYDATISDHISADRERIKCSFLQLNNLRITHEQEQFLTQGWSAGEKWFCWNDGNSAKIRFVVPQQTSVPTRISIAGFPNGAQQIILVLNGQTIFSGDIENDKTLMYVTIPSGLLHVDGKSINELNFVFPNARQPGNGDPRKLAFAFINLELH